MAAPSILEEAARVAADQRAIGLRLRALCVAAAILLALGNLFYWAAATARGDLGEVWPMSPVSAVAFLLLGVGFAIRLAARSSARLRASVAIMAMLAVVAATAAFAANAASGIPDWERVFDPARLRYLGNPTGRTTFTVALLVVVTALNLGLVSVESMSARWRNFGSVSAASCSLLGFFSLVADTAANPIFSGGGLLKVNPAAALQFMLLNAVLALSPDFARQLRTWLLGVDEREALPLSLRPDRVTLQLLGVLALIALAGVTYLRVHTNSQRRDVTNQLRADVEMKAAFIAKWRQEREGDAGSIWAAPWFREMASALASAGIGPEKEAELKSIVSNYIQVYRHRRATILDAQLRPVIWTPDEPDLMPVLSDAPQAFSGRFFEMPVHVDRRGELLSGQLVRIRQKSGEETGAYTLLQQDLAATVFPTLRLWPRGNLTGQSVLWLRRGNQLFALGGFRDAAGFPPESRAPFVQMRTLGERGSALMSRMAQGETRVIEGASFRGVPVLAVGRLIPGSDWMVTSSIDASEAYAPLRRNSWVVIGFGSLVLGSVGLVTTRFWRTQHQALLHDRLAADLERKRAAARLGMIMDDALDVVLLLDAQLRIEEANQQALKMYGWSRAELLGKFFRELWSEQEAARVDARDPGEMLGGIHECVHRRKDGMTLVVEVSSRGVEMDGRFQWLAIIRDISDRKRAEAALIDSERQLHHLIGRLHTVREDEAKRIARELHDDLGQQLTSLNMELADLERKLPQATAAQLEQIVRMRGVVDRTIETVQKISGELRLGQLDILGLTPAIEWHMQEFARQSGISCRIVRLDETPCLTDVQRTTVFRILQEALTNIARHARASEVNVSLEKNKHELALSVSDNGCGISTKQLNDRNSIGLLGMRERALLVDGKLTVSGREGEGTMVVLRVPLTKAAISNP